MADDGSETAAGFTANDDGNRLKADRSTAYGPFHGLENFGAQVTYGADDEVRSGFQRPDSAHVNKDA